MSTLAELGRVDKLFEIVRYNFGIVPSTIYHWKYFALTVALAILARPRID